MRRTFLPAGVVARVKGCPLMHRTPRMHAMIVLMGRLARTPSAHERTVSGPVSFLGVKDYRCSKGVIQLRSVCGLVDNARNLWRKRVEIQSF